MATLYRTILICATLFAFTLGASEASAAKLPDNIPEITAHLEFLGYKVGVKPKALTAKHAKYVDILVRKHQGGILITGFFGASTFAKSHRSEFLEFANKLNANAAVLRAYLDKDGDLALEAWFPDQYERTRFGVFLESWNSDLKRLMVGLQADAEKFLK